MVPAASISPRVEEERYLALLRAANEIATSSSCEATSNALVTGLREVIPFDYLRIDCVHDKETSAPCQSHWEVNGTENRRLV